MGETLLRLEDFVSETLGISPELFEKIIWTIAVGLLLVLARAAFLFLVSRRIDDPARRYIAVKTVNYLLGFAALLGLLRIWLGGITGLAASIGIISAGVASCFQQ